MKRCRARRVIRGAAEATFGVAVGIVVLVGLTIWTINARIVGESDG